MPCFCDQGKWKWPINPVRLDIESTTSPDKKKNMQGMKNLTRRSISCHGTGVQPAVNKGGRDLCVGRGICPCKDKMHISFVIFSSWGRSGVCDSLSSAEL